VAAGGGNVAVDSVTSSSNTQTVYQKHDAERVGPDGDPRQGEKGKQERRKPSPDAPELNPVPNEQGQTTGKVIDTTA